MALAEVNNINRLDKCRESFYSGKEKERNSIDAVYELFTIYMFPFLILNENKLKKKIFKFGYSFQSRLF